ncbi:MAG: Hpt domain-containing protein [Oligoflexia bacterium]|nr:Hpt domain-containing protein [Oligoflexia bacterium]
MIDWENDPEMKALRDEFIASLADRSELLRVQLQALADPGKPREEALGKLRYAAHTLAGAAGSYGLETLGAQAARLEELLLEGAEPHAIEQAVEALRALLAKSAYLR